MLNLTALGDEQSSFAFSTLVISFITIMLRDGKELLGRRRTRLTPLYRKERSRACPYIASANVLS